MTQLSPRFTLRELTRSTVAERRGIDNAPDTAATARLRQLCLRILEPIRSHFGRPVRISSGYRCAELNALVGGAPTSRHVLGEAADLEVDDASNLAVAHWLVGSGLPFDQVILEFHVLGSPTSGWVHVSHTPDAGANRGEVLTVHRTNGKVITAQGLPPLR